MDEFQLDVLMVRIDQLETEFSAPFMPNPEKPVAPINDGAPVKKKSAPKKKAVKK
jgi:hypothetical protein